MSHLRLCWKPDQGRIRVQFQHQSRTPSRCFALCSENILSNWEVGHIQRGVCHDANVGISFFLLVYLLRRPVVSATERYRKISEHKRPESQSLFPSLHQAEKKHFHASSEGNEEILIHSLSRCDTLPESAPLPPSVACQWMHVRHTHPLSSGLMCINEEIMGRC